MQRWYPVLAVGAVGLWAVVLVTLAADSPRRTILVSFDLAALATGLVHLTGLAWFRVIAASPTGPGWLAVQAAKHRRKGAYFAAWGLAVATLAWFAARFEPATGGLAWFGAAGNLGFQPGLLLAGWLGIVARSKLAAVIPGPARVEVGVGHPL